MRMIQALLMSLCVFLSSFCLTEELNSNQTEMETQKFYISHEQIVLTEEGIFVTAGNALIPVSQINCDSNGIYLSPHMTWTKQQCTNGHNIRCRRCYGCDWRKCEFACKCS